MCVYVIHTWNYIHKKIAGMKNHSCDEWKRKKNFMLKNFLIYCPSAREEFSFFFSISLYMIQFRIKFLWIFLSFFLFFLSLPFHLSSKHIYIICRRWWWWYVCAFVCYFFHFFFFATAHTVRATESIKKVDWQEHAEKNKINLGAALIFHESVAIWGCSVEGCFFLCCPALFGCFHRTED